MWVVLQIRKICDSPSQPERIDSTLSLLNNETEEFKILEATKLLMFDVAVQLHRRMTRGDDVPIFAMLLFARDSSESPRRLLTNHLNRTGDTGGLEQVSNCTPSLPTPVTRTSWMCSLLFSTCVTLQSQTIRAPFWSTYIFFHARLEIFMFHHGISLFVGFTWLHHGHVEWH